jgi:hypothetical protein
VNHKDLQARKEDLCGRILEQAMPPPQGRSASSCDPRGLRGFKAGLICLTRHKKSLRCGCLFLGLLLLTAHPGRPWQQAPAEDINAFVRAVVEHEFQEQNNDRSCWLYTSRTLEAGAWRTERAATTNLGTLTGLLTENGRPLTPKQEQMEEQRLQNLIRNPRELSRQDADRQQDWQRVERLARLLPDAFLYTKEATEGQVIQLIFRPNPRFEPPTFEAELLRPVVGTMRIDTRHMRIVEFRAQLESDVEFGWGILGKVRKGGLFQVRQEQVASGYWEIILVNVNISGRLLLFRSIGEEWYETRGEFRRIPENTSLETAAEMLKKDLQVFRHKMDSPPIER